MSIWALQSENAKVEFKMLRDLLVGMLMEEKRERKEKWGELQIVM